MYSPFRYLSLGAMAACTSCGDAAQFEEVSEPRSAHQRLAASYNDVIRHGREECDVREMARLGQQRGNTGSVQHYASTVTDEHGTLFINLQQTVQNRGGALAYEMTAAGAQQYEQLANYAGSNFDRSYLAGQIQLQQATQASLSDLQATNDSEIRTWAQQAANVWQRDEQWARQIYASIIIDTDVDDSVEGPFSLR